MSKNIPPSNIFQINVAEPVISKSCIEKCIKIFHNILKQNISNPVLEITADQTIENIDVLLLAYISLFQAKKSDISIDIIFKANDVSASSPDKTIIRFFHQIAQLQMITRSLDIKIKGDNRAFSLTESLFTWSERFIPIIFVNTTYYESVFEKSPTFKHLNVNDLISSVKDTAYQNCRKKIFHASIPNVDPYSALAQLAFYKALDQANILTTYLHELSKGKEGLTEAILNANNIKVGQFSTKIAIRVYKSIKSEIFDKLILKPPIYHFIYSTLLCSDLQPEGQITDIMEKKYLLFLKNCWRFTNELVDGLRELAKNIIEHSSSGHGVITGQVYKQDRMKEYFKSDQSKDKNIDRYLEIFNGEGGNDKLAFFEINVVDDGLVGVVENMKKSLEDNSQNTTEDYEDLNELTAGNVKLQHFLDASMGLRLNQQAKRAYAHLGLLIFAKLVSHNRGIIRAGTWLKDEAHNLRDNAVILPDIIPGPIDSTHNSLPPMGTNYHFFLPFDPATPLVPYKMDIDLPADSTAFQMQNIESLLTFQIKDFTNGYDGTLEENTNYLFITNSTHYDRLVSREEEAEFFKDFTSPFLETHKLLIRGSSGGNKAIVCLDLENIKVDSSNLFRLLGRWELEYPGSPLMIYNINTDIYLKFIDVNKHYALRLKDRVQYWDENSIAVIYSCHGTENKFYFTDVVWGKTERDFLLLNQIISKTNFNAVIVNDGNFITDNIPPEYNKLLSRFSIFQNGINLLPFDLLLKNSEGLSLFEQNTMRLLNNHLNV